MSQIFEALRRSREPDRHERSAGPSARADAVLATMGFASERKRRPRERYAPVVLVLLLAVIAWFGWRWYGERGPAQAQHSQPAPTVSSEATVLPPAARTASPPSAPLPTQLPATTSARATASPPSPRARVPAVPKTQSAPTAPLQLAIHYHRTGDFDKALQQYRTALQQNDLDAQAHNNLGLLYRDRGSLEDAVAQFRRALVVDDGYPTARNNLGVALLGLGRLDEAASAFQTALERDPHHVDAMVNLALVDKAAGRHGVAMERLAGALANDPRSAAAHYNLAVLYEHSGEASRAGHHYRRFLEHAGPEHAGRVPEVRDRIGELSKRVLRDRSEIEFRLP